MNLQWLARRCGVKEHFLFLTVTLALCFHNKQHRLPSVSYGEVQKDPPKQPLKCQWQPVLRSTSVHLWAPELYIVYPT